MEVNFIDSFNVSNEIADEIGMERVMCQCALTESFISYKVLHAIKESMISEGASENNAIKMICNQYFDKIFSGIYLIGEKFPDEPSVITAKQVLIEYGKKLNIYRKNQIVSIIKITQ